MTDAALIIHPPPSRFVWRELRCPSCGALLFKYRSGTEATIQIVCWRRTCRRETVKRLTEAGENGV